MLDFYKSAIATLRKGVAFLKCININKNLV